MIIFNNNNDNDNNNNNNINTKDNNDDNPYDRLSKSIKKTAGELFNGNNRTERRSPWFKLSKESIQENINERNKFFTKYCKDKSISNLTFF